MSGKKWRVMGGVSGFVVGGAIALSVASVPVAFAALMGGGAIGLFLGALAFLIYSHPVRFSLRTLMLVVTALAVLLGVATARINYLLGRAAYHEREANAYLESQPSHLVRKDLRWAMDSFISTRGRATLSTWTGDADDDRFTRHCVLIGVYRRAVYRPWMIVDESKPPEYPE